MTTINRRKALQLMGTAAVMPVVHSSAASALALSKPKFTFCLNMATIRGQKLGFMKELETAARAGYESIEIWMDSLQEYLQHGGSLTQVKRVLNDLDLKIENCIAFSEWVVDDEATRKKALKEMKVQMGMLAEINCRRMAATGKGLTNETTISLDTIAERYETVLKLGISMGVIPMLEMWGFQKKLSTVAEVTYSAMQSRNLSARILLDIFHLYKGNTPLDTLSFINPEINDILHMNDYPSTISRKAITDADRIYPGDGVAPIKQILQILKRHDQPLILSAELFNAKYYKQDALVVAKTALEKMKRIAEQV
jgi:sugar phosphate isomerase/epimerase